MLSVMHPSMVSEDNSGPYVSTEGIQQAVKIQCTSINNLETKLNHLACSKFTEEDQIYIDNYSWNDLYSSSKKISFSCTEIFFATMR